jgi:hypothetical protein
VYGETTSGTVELFSGSTASTGNADRRGAVASIITATSAYAYGTWAATAP